MYRNLIYLLFSFLLCTGFAARAQQNELRPRYSVGLRYFPGEIIRHSDNVATLPSYAASSFYLNAGLQTDTSLSWAALHGFPDIGLTMVYSTYEAQALGSSFALVPYIEKSVPLFSPKLHFKYHIGWGIGYGTAIYDPIENPANNVLSTHLNTSFDFRAGLRWEVYPRLTISAEAGLLHLSNMAVQMPNYGVNLFQVGAGVGYDFGPEVFIGEKEKSLGKREFLAVLNLGRRQILTTLNRYWVQSLLVEYNFLNGEAHRFGIGAAVMNDAILEEYNDWANDWGDGTHKDYNLWQTLNFGPYLNYEMAFSRFSAYLHAGAYLLHPYREFSAKTDYGHGPYYHYATFNRSYIFNRVGLRYRFKRHFLLNFGLKTHLFQAQYLEFGLGTYF